MDLSFVFPCLNEEETLPSCIEEVRTSLEGRGVDYEIVVADNGSTDRSAELAEALGARVVPVEEKGYGAAVRGGIEAAEGKYVMFADGDGSYLLEDAHALYQEALAAEADMAIAVRSKGRLEPGAMPLLHRCLGTPVLTWLINILFRGRVSDCNSGFRCLRKEAYQEWQVRAAGMEFASELLIKALKHKARIVETPSGLRRDRRSRPPHLRTWRDGMRHLLFIISEKPQLFERLGLLLVLLASLIQVCAFALGPTRLLVFDVFDYHTQALLIPVGCAGIQLYLLGCCLFVSGGERPLRVTERVIGLDEAHVLFLLLSMAAVEGVGFLLVLWQWRLSGFSGLDLIRLILFVTHFLCILGFAGVGLLGIHVLKKAD